MQEGLRLRRGLIVHQTLLHLLELAVAVVYQQPLLLMDGRNQGALDGSKLVLICVQFAPGHFSPVNLHEVGDRQSR